MGIISLVYSVILFCLTEIDSSFFSVITSLSVFFGVRYAMKGASGTLIVPNVIAIISSVAHLIIYFIAKSNDSPIVTLGSKSSS